MQQAVHDPGDASQWSEGAGGEPLPELPAILDLLRRRCALDFSGYKTSTLSRRVLHRMAQCEAADGAAYLRQLGDDETQRNALASDLLIHVTEFFRDAAVFAQLADVVLPDLLRGRDPGDDLRIWSAGCSTGEEAYGLAMLALDVAGRMGFHGNVKVFATDMAGDVLEQASRGQYSREAVAAVPEALLRRYFLRDPEGRVRVDTTLRRHVVFARHNLLSDPPFTRIDLAVCRNLLIYLKPKAQIKALSQLHFALKPQGVLLLGASETVGALDARPSRPWIARTSCFASRQLRWRAASSSPRWAPGWCRCKLRCSCPMWPDNRPRCWKPSSWPRASACRRWCWNCRPATSAWTWATKS